ncbi:MAG: Hpt domain-containing protein [Syntrophus sp. (in: bacteria)]|nr:Hpt domain-containing protein [Syntrophus sp. (in: bacteria)]
MTQKPNDRITLRIDPDLADLIPGFLEGRRQDVTAIMKALEQNDDEAIRILGHNMKGCGSGYGFDGITDLGKSLEQAAKKGDTEEIKRKVSELSAYLDSLDIVYE